MKTYTIRPLNWEESEASQIAVGKCHQGIYTVEKLGEWYGWWWTERGTGSRTLKCTSLEDGKAKAEADWQARILPALEEVTSDWQPCQTCSGLGFTGGNNKPCCDCDGNGAINLTTGRLKYDPA